MQKPSSEINIFKNPLMCEGFDRMNITALY